MLMTALLPLTGVAQSAFMEMVWPDDDDDRYIRENPQIEYDDDIDIVVPDFINTDKNHIILNGADWRRVRNAIAGTDHGVASIVQIGDSHVQADINSATTRDLLQYDYGDAGRGIITPLRMSGTNEPRDYTFSSNRAWSPLKLMRYPWKGTMGFTGTSISTSAQSSSLTFGTSTKDDYHPFSSVIIFHEGDMRVTSATDGDGDRLNYSATSGEGYTIVHLDRPVTRVTVSFDIEGKLSVFGASLSGDRPGVFYHAIGNNGATYATYNRIGTVGQGLQPLDPDLVIISLGTNEAFGRLDAPGFYRSIDKLVNNIKASNPDTPILLMTPVECRRHGAVNSNILPLRNEILRYGRENNVAVYDWYEVAGGEGASADWIRDGYFAGDRIHHTAKGYTLQGLLLYQALVEEFGR